MNKKMLGMVVGVSLSACVSSWNPSINVPLNQELPSHEEKYQPAEQNTPENIQYKIELQMQQIEPYIPPTPHGFLVIDDYVLKISDALEPSRIYTSLWNTSDSCAERTLFLSPNPMLQPYDIAIFQVPKQEPVMEKPCNSYMDTYRETPIKITSVPLF